VAPLERMVLPMLVNFQDHRVVGQPRAERREVRRGYGSPALSGGFPATLRRGIDLPSNGVGLGTFKAPQPL
jgi:hypothetical protein